MPFCHEVLRKEHNDKSNQWRANRSRIRREKARIRKLKNPDRRENRRRTGGAQVKPAFDLWGFLSRIIPKEDKRKDKRQAHRTGQESGDR